MAAAKYFSMSGPLYRFRSPIYTETAQTFTMDELYTHANSSESNAAWDALAPSTYIQLFKR